MSAARTPHWYLPEGASGTFFQTFVLVANPGDAPVDFSLYYFGEGGEFYHDRRSVPAKGRVTINVGDEATNVGIPPGGVATEIDAYLTPLVVERSMYWAGELVPWGEAHNTFGLVDQGTLRWGLAEGRIGGPRDYRTYVLLASTSQDHASDVAITFLRENGPPIVKNFTVPLRSRRTVDLGVEVPELQNESFGAEVRVLNDVPIFVEHSMDWNAAGAFWAGGTNASATPLK